MHVNSDADRGSHVEESGAKSKCRSEADLRSEDVKSTDKEPTIAEHGKFIATGAATATLSYGFCRLFVPSERAEDIVDMCHSLATSGIAIYGIGSMKPHPLHKWRLPPHLASGSGPIVRMFTCSMGYFGADFALIVVDVLFRGKFPHLWAGRLGHHVIQFVANSYCAFGKRQRADVMLANRSVLCAAYLAELSSVFLRLSNLLRHAPSRARLAVNWILVATFFGSRIINFPWVISMYWKCHTISPPHMYNSYLAVTSLGYALSLGWFMKIVRIALKTHADSSALPSLEC